ncbi:MAG: helix-turn-helix domain-containing protein [Planctomycetota bacterium]
MHPDPWTAIAEVGPLATRSDSHLLANAARPEIALSDGVENLLVTVPEGASLLRVSVRTVWRLMADPASGFPKPRRIRGRTLLVRDELLAFLEVEAHR